MEIDATPARLCKKRKIDNTEKPHWKEFIKGCSSFQSRNESPDSDDIFGQFIASKLKEMNAERKTVIMKKILDDLSATEPCTDIAPTLADQVDLSPQHSPMQHSSHCQSVPRHLSISKGFQDQSTSPLQPQASFLPSRPMVFLKPSDASKQKLNVKSTKIFVTKLSYAFYKLKRLFSCSSVQ